MSIKACFSSRFSCGYLVEVDFSQLEVVALAILSKDGALIDDILSGRDMHRKRAAELWSIPEHLVSPQQRQIAKQLSFQLQYGAGAKSMAEKNGVAIGVAQQFINNYYARYSKVKEWQDIIKLEVEKSRKPSGKFTPKGAQAGVGVHDSPTGRMYKFYEYDSSYHKGTSFSPTEIKNYPVQGFATGDIMALYRGRLYRRMVAENIKGLLMINTVHDSVMFDVNDYQLVHVINSMCKEEAEKLPKLLKDLWGIDCPVPLKVETKYGTDWSKMTKYEEM